MDSVFPFNLVENCRFRSLPLVCAFPVPNFVSVPSAFENPYSLSLSLSPPPAFFFLIQEINMVIPFPTFPGLTLPFHLFGNLPPTRLLKSSPPPPLSPLSFESLLNPLAPRFFPRPHIPFYLTPYSIPHQTHQTPDLSNTFQLLEVLLKVSFFPLVFSSLTP